jgi:hypothetical protein
MRQFMAGLTFAVLSGVITGTLPGALVAQDAQGTATQSRPALVVVELFTSQGCSSCPPADAMMAELATRDDVLPLSLHVDYWDYIGWRDEFAQPQFTDRQKAYAHAAGKRTIYTPQMIVQGLDHLVGAKPMRLVDLVAHHHTSPAAPVTLSVLRAGSALTVTALPTGALPPLMRLYLVRYIPYARVDIERGENAGRVVDYTNVVTQWTSVADWDGTAPLSVILDVPGKDRTAVILQAAGPGPILSVARAD